MIITAVVFLLAFLLVAVLARPWRRPPARTQSEPVDTAARARRDFAEEIFGRP